MRWSRSEEARGAALMLAAFALFWLFLFLGSEPSGGPPAYEAPDVAASER